MAKRSKNLFFMIIFAFFAMISCASAVEYTGHTNPHAHECGISGNTWSCSYNGKSWTWVVDENGRTDGEHFGSCEPLPVKLNEMSGCLFCPLFLTLFNAVQDISTNSFEALAESLRYVMLIGFAIWVSLFILPTITKLGGVESTKMLKSLFVQMFFVVLCFELLSDPKYIYHWVIDTILIAGMDFGNSYLFNVDTDLIIPTYGEIAVNDGVMNENVFFTLDKLLQALQQELGFLMAMASATVCVGLTSLNFNMFINGIFVYVLSLILLITFGFYLADAVIQLGIIGALMPLFIAAYPFKLTKGYSKKGIEVLMNSFFTFLIIGVVISIDTTLILQALVSGDATSGQDPKELIFKSFSENDIVSIDRFFDIGATGGVGLIACITIAFKFTQQVQSLADKYSGSSSLLKEKGGGMSSKIGAMGASFATSAAKKVGKPIGKAIDNSAVGNTYRKATAGIGRAVSKTGGFLAKYSGLKFAEKMAVNAGAKVYNAARGTGRAANKVGGAVSNRVQNSKFGKNYKKVVNKTRDKLNLDTEESRRKALDDKIDNG